EKFRHYLTSESEEEQEAREIKKQSEQEKRDKKFFEERIKNLEREKDKHTSEKYQELKDELDSKLNEINERIKEKEEQYNKISPVVRQSNRAKDQQLKKTVKNAAIGTIYFLILLIL